MSEPIAKTGETGASTPAGEETKTFTQEDVNRIVQERLSKERSKGDATLAQREQELAQRELLLTAKEKLSAKGLPQELLEALNISSSEALEKSLSVIEKLKISPEQSAKPSSPMTFSTGGYLKEPRDTEAGGIRAAMGLK